jgi:hypothetical protein
MISVINGDTTIQRAQAKIGKLCTKHFHKTLRVPTDKIITNFRYETIK